jgi:16S rRNA (adenine1518-N6/adenine1519-N6)-dimethyltransferase
MLQKEMARRLSAEPRTKDYGALTLLVQVSYRVKYLRSVPATVFLPEPEVDSAFIQLTPREPGELPDHDAERFEKLVRRGFSQRRKQLQKILREDVSDWGAAAEGCGFDPKARAEELSLAQWIALSHFGCPALSRDLANSAEERFAVVDAADRVIGDATRAKVHGDNLLHRAVHILLFNDADELFLQKRSRLKDRHPGVWDSSTAGHVDAGEDYDAAAARELREELGVSATLERISKVPASDRTGQEFIWLYRGRHNGPFRLARSEIECGEFFPLAVIAGWLKARPADFAPGFVECWNAGAAAILASA